ICRISVQSHVRRVDVSLPADTPLGALLPDVVEMLETDGGESRWQLSPIGKAPLELRESLRGNGIRNGDTLLLPPAEVSRPPPRFAEVTEAVLAGIAPRRRWRAADRRPAGTTAAVWSCLLGTSLLLHASLTGQNAVPMAAPALAAAITFAAAMAAGRVYRN